MAGRRSCREVVDGQDAARNSSRLCSASTTIGAAEKFKPRSSGLRQATMINQDGDQSQELSEVREALQRERDKADKLARELGRTVREPRFQSGTQADDATLNQPPTDDERPARRPSAQRTETSATRRTRRSCSAGTARTQDLERQLAAASGHCAGARPRRHVESVRYGPAPTTMQSTDEARHRRLSPTTSRRFPAATPCRPPYRSVRCSRGVGSGTRTRLA